VATAPRHLGEPTTAEPPQPRLPPTASCSSLAAEKMCREKGVRNHCLNERERVEDRSHMGSPVASHAGRKLC